MAPTTESALDHDTGGGWICSDTAAKEHQRPPIYNPEDYAQSLRKFGRRAPALGSGNGGGGGVLNGGGASPPGGGGQRLFPDNKSTLQSVGSGKSASCAALPLAGLDGGGGGGNLSMSAASLGSQRGSARGSTENLRAASTNGLQPQQPQQQQQQQQQLEPEMSLRQFDSVGELLNKLKADLRLAFPSFVREFVDSAVDGVSLLLELLRTVQLQQQGGGGGGGGGAGQRQALLQENACLQCLHGCLRCPDAPRRLAVSPAGLFTLAVSTMSSVNKSRVLALQLLTKTCEGAGEGHGAVSEALSTMRLRFGEPVRFRFLAGVLSSAGGQVDLLLAGLRFLNAFLRSAPGPQQRVYIQAELGQAGFQPDTLRQSLPAVSAGSAEVQAEFDAWQRQQVDVSALTQRCQQAETRADQLQDQLSQLQRRLQVLSLEHALKDTKDKDLKDDKDSRSTPAEDEGISSSDQDRSLSPDGVEREPLVYEVVLKLPDSTAAPRTAPRTAPRAAPCAAPKHDDDEEETTIEEVMEEFQNIINDAETEVYANHRPSPHVGHVTLDNNNKNVYVSSSNNSDTLTARIQVSYPQDNNYSNVNNRDSSSNNNSSRTPPKSGRLRLEALFQNGPVTTATQQRQSGQSGSSNNNNKQPAPPQPTQRLQQRQQQQQQPRLQDEEEHRHGESEIVPSKLLPQPPRRAKSLVHLCAPSKDYVNLCNSSPFFDDADSFSNVSGDNSDSLLSASREACRELRELDKNLRNASDSVVSASSAARGYANGYAGGYRSIAMIMPDEDKDDVIKPVEVCVYQGIPDILRCSSKQVEVDPATVRNGSNYQPASSCVSPPAKPPPPKTAPVKSPRKMVDNYSSDKSRTGSFDGLFYVADSPKASASSGKPPAVAPKKKSLRSPTSASDSQRAAGAALAPRRVKSKSLERVDEGGGLNSMVDMVVPQQQQQQLQRLAPDGVFQSREWGVEWGQSRLPAVGRLPVPSSPGPVVVVRSTSVRHQQVPPRPGNRPPARPAGRRTPPEGATHPLFLPVSSRVSAFEKSEPRLGGQLPGRHAGSTGLVIKRGHTNAGLYSGHHLLRDSPGGVNMAKIVSSPNSPGAVLSSLPADFGRGIHVNLAVPSGKLTDLPSGLY